ncbi:MAG: pilus assembly protein N-terminal domain-containing protein [Planctomycetota bacterium]
MTATTRCSPFVTLGLVLMLSPASLASIEAPTGAAAAQPTVITVGVGRSQLVTAPWKAARVSIAQPEIADVQVLSPTQLLVLGKAVGATDLVLFGEGDAVWQARVAVEPDLSLLKAELLKLFPRSQLEVIQTHEVLAVTGTLERTEDVAKLHTFFEAHGSKYVDLTRVAGVHQVLLQVKVAEVSRRAIRTLGINGFPPTTTSSAA